MMQASSMRRTRSASAGDDSATRSTRALNEMRAFSGRAVRMLQPISSSRRLSLEAIDGSHFKSERISAEEQSKSHGNAPRRLRRIDHSRPESGAQRGITMSAQNRELVLRHHDEVWTKGNFDAVDEIYAPDFVGHHPGKRDWVGAAGVKLMVQNVRAAFPDFREPVEDVGAADDKVVTGFTAAGTHLGILRGIAPTGKAFRMAEIGIFRILNGRIAEKWGMIDRLGMFQQLGIVPAAWPPMEFLYEITMDVTAHDVGLTPSGRRRIVQVTGGTFDGPRLRGRVLPGGGDWLLERPHGSSSQSPPRSERQPASPPAPNPPLLPPPP